MLEIVLEVFKSKNVRSNKHLHKKFSELDVLKGVDIKVDKNEIVSSVGASGAGKTTLLQIIGTLEKSDSGSIFF